MNRDSIDLGEVKISRLFRIYLVPTLLGMLSLCAVTATERLAILSAVVCGVVVSAVFFGFPSFMTGLFLERTSLSGAIATADLPYFACAFVFFIFNLTAIGYFQSVEMVWPATIFALLRGAVFLIPAFIVAPMVMGTKGIWLAPAASEILTSVSIIAYYLCFREKM